MPLKSNAVEGDQLANYNVYLENYLHTCGTLLSCGIDSIIFFVLGIGVQPYQHHLID